MKTYAAVANANVAGWVREIGYDRILTAFGQPGSRVFEVFDYPILRMLDSGAFSLWSIGKQVNIDDYIEWCLAECRKTDDPTRVTNLDVIPGARGQMASKRERTAAIKKSAANAETIRSAGLRVVEVYHVFEPLSVLDKIVERRRPGEVIGIGGMAGGKSRQVNIAFGESVFARLRDLCGWDALPPVHAFGLGTGLHATRFPLASCDSSAWTTPARWGFGVHRSKRISRKQVETSTSLKHPVVYMKHIRLLLESWRAREELLEKLWAERGVVILPEERSALIATRDAVHA